MTADDKLTLAVIFLFACLALWTAAHVWQWHMDERDKR